MVVYGAGDVAASHPVVAFLVAERRAAAVLPVAGGYPALAAAYPFLATPSLKAAAARTYPHEVADSLFLGNWDQAASAEVLSHLRIGALITIYNTPEALRPPPGTQQLRIVLADAESEDIGPHLRPAAAFIAAALAARRRVLVHCGAGVSRSASLVIAFLVAERGMGAAQALAHCQAIRPVVKPTFLELIYLMLTYQILIYPMPTFREPSSGVPTFQELF